MDREGAGASTPATSREATGAKHGGPARNIPPVTGIKPDRWATKIAVAGHQSPRRDERRHLAGNGALTERPGRYVRILAETVVREDVGQSRLGQAIPRPGWRSGVTARSADRVLRRTTWRSRVTGATDAHDAAVLGHGYVPRGGQEGRIDVVVAAT